MIQQTDTTAIAKGLKWSDGAQRYALDMREREKYVQGFINSDREEIKAICVKIESCFIKSPSIL